MTKFGNKLQTYTEGKAESCEHPIIWVDDNRLCHQCNQYVPIRKDEHIDTITLLTAANDRQALMIYAKDRQIAELTRMLFALGKQDGQTIRAQAEEIRTLKKPCILFQQAGDQ
jgi:hypothetical protein